MFYCLALIVKCALLSFVMCPFSYCYRYWEKYLACNDTVVARTFQGQFKNTVVCSVCNFVSVSFEPFMYLPVPLPNAHILQLQVGWTNLNNLMSHSQSLSIDQDLNSVNWPKPTRKNL